MARMQFGKAYSSAGASMGRRSKAVLCAEGRIRLQRVRLDVGGYDSGGAYWGLGEPLWVAEDADGERSFFRARDRDAAKAYVRNELADNPEDVKFYR